MRVSSVIKRLMVLLPLLCFAALPVYPYCGDGGGSGDTKQKDFTAQRAAMVRLLRVYGVKDKHVLAAMAKVRRHMYIPASHRWRADAYGDHPCAIGCRQTISQPYIVAYMTEKMNLKKGEKVLEIGTGSGYQAAVLAEMGAKLYTVEIIKELAEHARKTLDAEGYKQVKCRLGDGYKGWAEHAPYDAIIVTCAPEKVPPKLVEQLKEGGRMILPVGAWRQRLVILRKKKGKTVRENDLAVRFVPMVHGKD